MAWYNSNWTKRRKVTVASSQIDSSLTDFPVYVDLSGITGISNPDGIRVTKADETTELAREIVSADEMHFKADSLSSTTDTDFYIYYGNSGASDYSVTATYGAQNVWSDYKAVYHLEEDPSGNGADAVKDSTSNANHLTPSGGPVNSTGKLAGNAITFDGTDDQLKDTDQVWANADNVVTIQFWNNVTSTAAGESGHNAFGYAASGDERCASHAPWADTIYWDFGTCCTDSRVSGSYTAYDDKWTMIHLTNSASLQAIYLDGSSEYTSTTIDDPDTDLTGFAVGSAIDSNYHDGIIDEFRIRVEELSSNWISAEYTNQNTPTTFYTVGSEETDVEVFSLPNFQNIGGANKISF